MYSSMQVDAALSAEDALARVAGRGQRLADPARLGQRLLLDILHMRQLPAHARHQLRTHGRAHRTDVVLDEDGDVQRLRQASIVRIAALRLRMQDVGRHGHDAVRAGLLGEAAQRDGGQHVARRGGGDHRHLAGAFGHHDLDPAAPLVVGQGGELAGVGRADQPVCARLDAEADLPAQALLVQLVALSERRNDDDENAAPGLGHGSTLLVTVVICIGRMSVKAIAGKT